MLLKRDFLGILYYFKVVMFLTSHNYVTELCSKTIYLFSKISCVFCGDHNTIEHFYGYVQALMVSFLCETTPRSKQTTRFFSISQLISHFCAITLLHILFVFIVLQCLICQCLISHFKEKYTMPFFFLSSALKQRHTLSVDLRNQRRLCTSRPL